MKCGLIGNPLKHSYSPQIHGMLSSYEYKLYPIEQSEVDTLFKEHTLDAFNVTIPYKKVALKLCDTLSKRAQDIGAVNTVVTLYDGTYFGDNTDYDGFCYLSEHAGCDWNGKTVAILGTGGATVMAANVCKDGAAKKIYVVSRDIRKAAEVTSELNKAASGRDIFVPLDYESIKSGCDASVLINATPMGMYPDCLEPIVSLSDFAELKYVFDLVANPYRTKLVLEAKNRNLVAEGGLRMLIAQAVSASEAFIRKEPYQITKEDYPRIEKIYEAIKGEQCNIVLIGMPGCGKSTYGAKLAKKTGRKLIDTDSVIEEEMKMSIPDIFERFGEKRFRDIESDVIKRVTKGSNLVIATGGGAVLNEENRLNLMMNAMVYYIDTPIDLLATDKRPLSKDRAALESLYEKRHPIYSKMADEVIRRGKDTNEN